jgi:hypothetical protein
VVFESLKILLSQGVTESEGVLIAVKLGAIFKGGVADAAPQRSDGSWPG